MRSFDVYFLDRWMDRVFFDADMTAEWVKRSLVHDGFPTGIVVRANPSPGLRDEAVLYTPPNR